METLYEILGINSDIATRKKIADEAGIPIQTLNFYDDNNILPDERILQIIQTITGKSKLEIMLRLGIYNSEIKELIAQKASLFCASEGTQYQSTNKNISPKIVLQTQFGQLFQGDCLDLLSHVDSNKFDLIFADPPFNLNKLYPSKINDNLHVSKYLSWCEAWLDECIRTLKVGGSLFIWNIPKWNTYLSAYLNQRLTFRNWIAVDIKYSLPIANKLYPSHYSLLYYIKGDKPNTFKPDRLPMEICKHCFHEIKDYGGYKNKMNPLGISLSDVWYDIPPVRHVKYKARQNANELSTKLIDRIIELSTNVGDVIFDPFGGAGTTYITAELKKRHWMGVEIGPTDDIINRFNNIAAEQDLLIKYRRGYNALFSPEIHRKRVEKGFWTCDSFKEK